MKKRDVILIVIVFIGIGWLILDNYKRGQKPAAKPQTQEQVKK